ncbi:TPA: ATP-dependent DNA ligase [Candidatus Bathyarchaeota archaeon]|nr:ATP-dependent DNA ligase [Candidatus Bathyarchaeota archaeon]
MEFEALSKLCEKISTTTKRNVKVDLVAEFLRMLDYDEIEPAVSMILGRPFPRWYSRALDVSWATLSNVMQRLTDFNWKIFKEAFRSTGDLGSAVKTLLELGKIKKQKILFEKSLSIKEVRRILEAIAEATGQGSREKKDRLLESLLSRATPLEAKYIVKILIGEMRTGFQEGLMELAVSKAFSVPLEEVQKASMLTGDISEVASLLKRKGKNALSKVSFRLMNPLKPMLAQMVSNPEEAIREHGGITAFEFKLDGARIQIHKMNEEVKIFSRRLSDVTRSLPDIVEIVKEGVKARRAILEGEVITIGENEHPLPFQNLMRRFRRVYDIERMVQEIPVKLFLFDILYLNGESLINSPYLTRRNRLKEIVNSISLTEQIITDNLKEAEEFFRRAIKMGHEGLMAKRLNSPYTPGVRGKHWLKIKETLEPLDLVIVAAEYGYGRRHKWLSDYYLAARDEETGALLVVGKTFKGLTDSEIIEMTNMLKNLALNEDGHRVVVKPKIVVEVMYNEIQKSPKYRCGMALRFARIARIRYDKSPDEADTIQKVRKIYENQFKMKAKF